MAHSTRQRPGDARPREASNSRVLVGVACAVAALFTALAALQIRSGNWLGACAAGLVEVVLLGVALVARERLERRRLLGRVAQLARQVKALAEDPKRSFEPQATPDLAELAGGLRLLARRLATQAEPPATKVHAPLTRSGLYAADEPASETELAAIGRGEPSALDMVSRLEPRTLRWLESSPAEQEFLGWPVEGLRQKSFPELVHADDRSLAWEQLRAALYKGEAHGLVYRIRTARGEAKAIEMNVSVRYGTDSSVSHLRCHVTDVTAKVRASKELRRRTRELTLVNQLLRRTNRELQELKNRYSDLYQNAPAMYFSLDMQGNMIECNNTLVTTLGYPREELVGQPYTVLLTESRKARFPSRFAEFLRTGHVEVESRWKTADGRMIDVWVTATAVRGPDGEIAYSRSVAQDITARRALEAELKEKNSRLARTIDELSRKNKELDEFTYVVSHDLQEPVRTLIAFSDFLLNDCGQQLDATGKEYVGHLVEAARRMRALISDLLTLSRAGKATADFLPVNMGDVLARVKSDLAELIRSKGAEVCTGGTLPLVWGDCDRIAQLLANLVSNGLKYNEATPPRVEIAAVPSETGGWATFAIRDNGIGIEPEYHKKIFQIFRRLHPREQYEGTGAGLAICQKIVQAHGGRIWVESQLGQGATFFITLRTPATTQASPIPAEAAHAT
ncbi:MAG TPA: ATP-binding protein [Isosphaeraceae bacterium]|nr:ATP-binding protein [Isosphaeraceae bacterium]